MQLHGVTLFIIMPSEVLLLVWWPGFCLRQRLLPN